MIEHASWLIQSIKGNRSKRLFGLPAPLVKGEKIAQFGYKGVDIVAVPLTRNQVC
jgi:hypothetical protein